MVITLETLQAVFQTTVETAAPQATAHHVIQATFTMELVTIHVQQQPMLLVQLVHHVGVTVMCVVHQAHAQHVVLAIICIKTLVETLVQSLRIFLGQLVHHVGATVMCVVHRLSARPVVLAIRNIKISAI